MDRVYFEGYRRSTNVRLTPSTHNLPTAQFYSGPITLLKNKSILFIDHVAVENKDFGIDRPMEGKADF